MTNDLFEFQDIEAKQLRFQDEVERLREYAPIWVSGKDEESDDDSDID